MPKIEQQNEAPNQNYPDKIVKSQNVVLPNPFPFPLLRHTRYRRLKINDGRAVGVGRGGDHVGVDDTRRHGTPDSVGEVFNDQGLVHPVPFAQQRGDGEDELHAGDEEEKNVDDTVEDEGGHHKVTQQAGWFLGVLDVGVGAGVGVGCELAGAGRGHTLTQAEPGHPDDWANEKWQ